MKSLCLLFSLVFLSSLSTNNDVSIITYWEVGDTQSLLIKEGFIQYENEEITKKEVSVSEVLIKVVEQTDTNYVIEWTYFNEHTNRINVEYEEDYMDKRMDELFAIETYRFETDEFGVFKRMLNLDEVIQRAKDSLDMLGQEMKDQGEEDVDMFIEMMKEMFGSELMLDEMERDIWNYHYYIGDIFPQDTLIAYEEEMDSKMSDDKIVMKGIISIKADTSAYQIMINDRKVSDSGLQGVLKNGLEKIDPKGSIKNKDDITNELGMDYNENYTYDYDYGWLKYYEKNQIIETSLGKRIKFLSMEDQSNK